MIAHPFQTAIIVFICISLAVSLRLSPMSMKLKINSPRIHARIPSTSLCSQTMERSYKPATLRYKHFINKKFRLIEVLNDEKEECIVDFIATGALSLKEKRKSSTGGVVSRASWRWIEDQGVLQMAIERTYMVFTTNFISLIHYNRRFIRESLVIILSHLTTPPINLWDQ